MTGSQTACCPRVFFLVAVSLCSSAVLEHVVVGQAVVTVSLVFSANLFSTTPPTLGTSKNKKQTQGARLTVLAFSSCFFASFAVRGVTGRNIVRKPKSGKMHFCELGSGSYSKSVLEKFGT